MSEYAIRALDASDLGCVGKPLPVGIPAEDWAPLRRRLGPAPGTFANAGPYHATERRNQSIAAAYACRRSASSRGRLSEM